MENGWAEPRHQDYQFYSHHATMHDEGERHTGVADLIKTFPKRTCQPIRTLANVAIANKTGMKRTSVCVKEASPV